MHTRILAVGLLALGLATSALMAGDNGKGKDLYRCSGVTGKYVMNGTGDTADTLGHIEDVVINLKDGRVIYYVLSHGETLGFGGKYFAIAPEAVRLTDDGQYFVLNGISNKDLDEMDGFDANKWPRMPNRKIGKGGEKDVGANTGKGGAKDVSLARTSRIIGMACRTADNKSLGSVYDLAMILDGGKARVHYAAISHGGTLGVGGKLYAVPLDKMRLGSPKLRPGERVFVINTTQKQFEKLDGFTSGDNWPGRPDEKFWAKVRVGSDKEED